MESEHLLNELNPEQLKAVTHNAGSTLVLAGAGSGKTRVLTTRITWLIKTQNVALHEILAVTFTNKAAKEMQARIVKQLAIDPLNAKQMWIGTFHSVALRLLSKHHEAAGLPAYFQILDANDQFNLLRRIIKNANLEEERYAAKDLQKFINQHKENGTRAKNLSPDGLRQQIWVELYIEYERICERDGLVDFTELLLRSYEMLSQNPAILESYSQQFRHILVDEFQDTNQLQYRWLKLLGASCADIFAVGDDDQSIYSFRGACVANMQTLVRDFKVKNPIRLEQNYRSTPHILGAANAVIGNNSDRMGKNLWTQNENGENICLYEGYTEEDEAYFVVDEIKTLQKSGVQLADIAILYRSNAQSRVFEQCFYNNGLPYRVYGGLRFFDRQEIKHVLAYLRLMLNINDNEAFLRVVNLPIRGIGAKALENLQAIAHTNNVSLFAACALLESKAHAKFAVFTDLIRMMQIESATLTLPEVVSYVVEVTGMGDLYRQDKKQGAERLENLNELVSAVAKFRANSDNAIAEFLTYAVLESTDSQASGQEQAVQLMTVHAAKGLEFSVVFVVGLEDGLFPHGNCLETKHELEEERRLMYVAMTRAKRKLYICRACSRLMWGKRQSAPVSRFVNEIPGELINNISGISHIGSNSLTDYALAASDGYQYTPVVIENPETKISRVKLKDNDDVIKIGDMITHAKFGNGKVVKLNVDGQKTTAEIFFIGIGKKTLDLDIARIQKV